MLRYMAELQQEISELYTKIQILIEMAKVNKFDFSEPKKYTESDIDKAYIIGVLNTSGMCGLSKELKRLDAIGKKPHQLLNQNNLIGEY